MGQKVVVQSTESVAPERHVELRVAIARARVRQGDIAAAVGISEGHLSHLLAGRKSLKAKLADQIEAAIAAAVAS